jgi:predicted DNA-binding ribbon-helix-helix protein
MFQETKRERPVSVSAFLPESLRNEAVRVARETDRPLSSIVRISVAEYLARRGTSVQTPVLPPDREAA